MLRQPHRGRPLRTARDIDGRLLWPPSPKDTAALAGSTFTRHAVVATAARVLSDLEILQLRELLERAAHLF